MRRLLATMFVLALILSAGTALAGQSGNCSPEGTWYGANSFGDQFIITIGRSGPKSYSSSMDNGVNLLFDGVVSITGWSGEFVKTGPRQYDWTTMALTRNEAGGPWDPFPFLLGLCPLTMEFTGCDSLEGSGVCEVYGYFEGQDPFEEGVLLLVLDELQNSFQRMPMTFPEP